MSLFWDFFGLQYSTRELTLASLLNLFVIYFSNSEQHGSHYLEYIYFGTLSSNKQK